MIEVNDLKSVILMSYLKDSMLQKIAAITLITKIDAGNYIFREGEDADLASLDTYDVHALALAALRVRAAPQLVVQGVVVPMVSVHHVEDQEHTRHGRQADRA